MAHVDAVRRFNRFYTKSIGILEEGMLRSPYSLTELRVLYEIANRDRPTAAELGGDLRVDRGYLSRILRRFQKQGLLRRETSPSDGRQSHLSLTEKGRRTFAMLNRRQHEEIATLIGALPEAERRRLVGSMAAIERILGAPSPAGTKPRYSLRQHRPGDIGWVVHRHGALYSQEFGYDEHFEALVAKVAAEFVEHYDPKRERCWIAERDGDIIGSVFLVKKSPTVAKLRLLYVEPSARGLGIGERLVRECIRFARKAGYRKMTLWTQSHLAAARRIYVKAGFTLTAEQPHHSYGKDLVAETWDLAL
jgi:DNA-binding MarR family transcriptional regulator/GNAT superfamily N-acetyltransferase